MSAGVVASLIYKEHRASGQMLAKCARGLRRGVSSQPRPCSASKNPPESLSASRGNEQYVVQTCGRCPRRQPIPGCVGL